MAIIKPPVVPPWAETAANPADIVQPSNAEIQAGWPQSATPPSRQRFNWILNYCANGIRYLVRRGISAWDAAETYGGGDITKASDGLLYRSLQSANTNRDPIDQPAQAAWWGSVLVPTPTAGDNTTKIATTAFVTTAIAGKANNNGNYPAMTVGNATNAANAAIAAAAGTVPWSGVTGRPTTVQGYGITNAIHTGNIATQSVAFATTAGRARPQRIDNANWDFSYSGQSGQPNWLLGTNDGITIRVYNPANFDVDHATSADTAVTRALGTSNTQIATTAFANPGALVATSGYNRMSSGLIMQWGRVTGLGEIPGNPLKAVGGVTFPLAFPNACFNVQTTAQDINGDAIVASVTSLNASGFSFAIREVVGNNQNVTLHWFAVGH